ncbi:hypothetical protein [Caulobacter sp.]|nr:hypothetical protein [Caulobacter sp.]MBQ1561807.1 hypothetical protein [Caulobacter sp.]
MRLLSPDRRQRRLQDFITLPIRRSASPAGQRQTRTFVHCLETDVHLP